MSLFCWTQRKIFWRMLETEQFWGTIDSHSIFFPTMEVNGAPKQPGYKLSSKYLPLCSAEQRNSYRFGTTWGNQQMMTIFIFGWTIPLSNVNKLNLVVKWYPQLRHGYFSGDFIWRLFLMRKDPNLTCVSSRILKENLDYTHWLPRNQSLQSKARIWHFNAHLNASDQKWLCCTLCQQFASCFYSS